MSADPQDRMDGMPAGLRDLVARAGSFGRGPAPVDKWEPAFCGDLDMEIRADGTWFYMGTPIGREALVRLFATVLRRDADGRFYLVTPVEKVSIRVEDAPFVGVELFVEGEGEAQRLTVRTNVGDVVTAGTDHPLEFARDAENDGLIPYILVRGRLQARLARPLLYQLVECGAVHEVDGVRQFGVWSDGAFFAMMPEAETGETAEAEAGETAEAEAGETAEADAGETE